jgi:hypothetical protein
MESFWEILVSVAATGRESLWEIFASVATTGMESFWEILASVAPVLLAGLGIYITISPVETHIKKLMVVVGFVIIGCTTSYATWIVLHSTTLSMQKTLAEVTGGDSLCYIMPLPHPAFFGGPPESHLHVINNGPTPCFNYSASFHLFPTLEDLTKG